VGKEGGGYQGTVGGQSTKQVEPQIEGGVRVGFWQFALHRSEWQLDAVKANKLRVSTGNVANAAKLL
jgi:hypothetical protein